MYHKHEGSLEPKGNKTEVPRKTYSSTGQWVTPRRSGNICWTARQTAQDHHKPSHARSRAELTQGAPACQLLRATQKSWVWAHPFYRHTTGLCLHLPSNVMSSSSFLPACMDTDIYAQQWNWVLTQLQGPLKQRQYQKGSDVKGSVKPIFCCCCFFGWELTSRKG